MCLQTRFKALTLVLSLTAVDGVDVMAELEDFFDKSIRKRKTTKACERRTTKACERRSEKKKRQLKRPAEERPPEEVAHEE